METTKINVNTDDELFRKYKNNNDLKARDEIIENYLYLAKIITKRYVGKGVDYDDLYQIACVGLIHAVERYDVDKGVRFSTFATPTILGEIKRYFRDKGCLIKLPRKIYEIFQKANRISLARMQYDGHVPTTDELATALGVSEKDILESMAFEDIASIQSLEKTMYEGSDVNLGHLIGVEENNFLIIENQDFLCDSMRRLTSEEKKLVVERFYKERTQKQVAEEWGVSQMYISRLERKVLHKIRSMYFDE